MKTDLSKEPYSTAAHAYFLATGHDVPSRIKPEELHEFLISEALRWKHLPGVAIRLGYAAKDLNDTLQIPTQGTAP